VTTPYVPPVANPGAYPVPPPPPPPPPPGFSFGSAYAGLLSRFVAVIVDFVILAAVALVVALPFSAIFFVATAGFTTPAWALSWLYGPIDLLMFALWILYFTYFEATSGQTLGKRLLGIRVISTRTGRPPDLGNSLIRNVLRIIDWLPAFYLLGFFVALISGRKQRMGDLAAGTIVVRV
jgi:uncharacterized RDD family membrane protein YckC